MAEVSKLSSKLSSRSLLLIFSACVLILCSLEYRSYIQFQNQQHEIAATVAKAFSLHLQEDLAIRNHQIKLFAEHNKDLISQLAKEPENEFLYTLLHQKTSDTFPRFFAMTIANETGKPMLDDFDGNIGEICIAQINSFVSVGNRDILIHPNHNAYHIDMMSRTSHGDVFFVSFEPDFLSQLIQNSKTPSIDLFLVKQQTNLIEVSREGSRDQMSRDFHLSPQELEKILVRKKLDSTQWELVILQAQSAWLNEIEAILLRTVLQLLVLSLLGFLLYRSLQREQQLNREAIQTSESARDLAETETRTKSMFLHALSHEIRTPLNAIQGFLGVLEESELDRNQQKHVHNAMSASKNLKATIDSIVEASLLQSEKIAVEVLTFSLHELMQKLLSDIQLKVDEKGLKLNYDNPLPPSACVKGAPDRITQVLKYLLNNAVKFTDRGEITVNVIPKGDLIRFSIIDTGIGISAKNYERVFESFTQLNDGLDRNYGGVGMGTTISKRLVDLMDGKIWFESEPGKGSQFHVELNLPPRPCRQSVQNKSAEPDYQPVAPSPPSTVNNDEDQASKLNISSPPDNTPYNELQKLHEMFTESTVDEQNCETVLQWARNNEMESWADALESAVDNFDFEQASSLIEKLAHNK